MTLPALLLVALQQAPGMPPDSLRSPVPEPRIVWEELPAELPQELRDSVRFGYLEVPQDHAVPDGPRIRIALLVVPTRSSNPASDPVVSIAGGPGLPAIHFHMQLRRQGPHPLDAFRDRRDLIVLDARGHGFSRQRTCDGLRGAEPLAAPAAAERLWLAKLEACRDSLRAAGVRLETLSSVQAAHDLELLRRALGAPRLNLVGLSYGSRIAGEALRQVPSSVRAVYYSGPVAAERDREATRGAIADEVLRTLFRRCASQPDCRTAYPRLAADYDTVLTRLRRRPERVRVRRSDAAPEGEVPVDEEEMRSGLAQLLLNRRLAAGAPLLIHTLAEQGVASLSAMAEQLIAEVDAPDVDPATFLSFWCNDGTVSSTSSELLQQRCRTWLGDSWTPRQPEPIRSDVPALIETGELDPRTPPSSARLVAARMPRAHLVILPWYGHERPPACALRIAAAFFDAPHEAPDVTCLDSIPPIDFVTGVAYSRWVGTAVGRAATHPWLAALPGAAALLLLVSVVGLPVRAIRVRRRDAAHRVDAGDWMILTVAAVGLTLVLGLAAALFMGMSRHFLIPLIGVPREWAALLLLPWVLLLLTPVAAFLTLRRHTGAAGEPATLLHWSVLVGATSLLAWCGLHAFL